MRYKATIDIYIDMDDRWSGDPEGALADGISDMMLDVEDRTSETGDGFRLIDWAYRFDGENYCHAEPFDGLTPEEELQQDELRDVN